MDGSTLAVRPPRPPAGSRDLLRFLTCGSVDDGKSTLIGRLLFDLGQVPDDQLVTLNRDSRRFGTDGDAADYALLLDGLSAEREQGITIDVAYRYFSSPRRSFIVADTPGHAQYTRNMATGASTCDLAVILVDATKGLSEQTRRHSRIVALFGIRQVILAVNKMDAVNGDAAVFDAIASAYAGVALEQGLTRVTAIPISARHGHNLVRRSASTPWYTGPTLIEALETADTQAPGHDAPFRLPVQYVSRPDQTFRGYSGSIASGRIAVGDPVVVAPSGRAARVARIVCAGEWAEDAGAGDAVTLVLDQDIDIARGDVLAPPADRPSAVDRFSARLLWMDEAPLDPARSYLLRIGTALVPARVTATDDAASLVLNEIGDRIIHTSGRVAFDVFADHPGTGALILIDRDTHATVAAGIALAALDQPGDIHRVAPAVDRAARERRNGHGGAVVWMTGLSGSGKSTIAAALERRLHAAGVRTVVLDGDNLRHGLNRDLGFSDTDRSENVRRVAEVAHLFAETGVVAICALISPTHAQRAQARSICGDTPFLEVFVNTPLDLCRARDPKALYARADAGAVVGLTGVGSTYEPPLAPDLILPTADLTPEAAARAVADQLTGLGVTRAI
ncbi:adenylyl-sulfate kinase [Brevundimonas subvibrioides]|uniref:Adenylyl-sulfate kinase n=1 Tax=Brevundimonas subvibrioides (strain ATCC 15264 / DSM 4735 / LMG 14903 / NBRC 16000 / CB 81) TaxID=633149 RepID=D9QGI7_BRESC|nr:adenylyl-sulfate kinase [Brevundimonas subvibrioides]ADL00803.1 sulfate adenylyltransferase, large subunit [Brevundimonas subvibrioides ATCC 15264]